MMRHAYSQFLCDENIILINFYSTVFISTRRITSTTQRALLTM